MSRLRNINVLVVDDHPLIRKAITRIVKAMPRIGACDEAENGQVAIDACRHTHYDIVFLDIGMPVMDGMTAAHIMKKEYPGTYIIILTMFDNKRQYIELLEMGVNGYLLKDCGEEEIQNAVDTVLSDGVYLTPEVKKVWMEHLKQARAEGSSSKHDHLSEREIEIVKLLCEQFNAREIAQRMNLSEATVNNHRSNVMKKIGAHNTAGIIVYAIREGIYNP